MKNFLKNHPCLSSIGIALTINSAITVGVASQTQIMIDPVLFFGFNIIGSTLPAIGATAIDKFVHQKLFDNKPLQ